MSEYSLPVGWEQCALGDYLCLKNGFAFKSRSYVEPSQFTVPVIRISDLDGKFADDVRARHAQVDPQASTFEIEKGDLLIAMSGATTGKVGIYKGNIPAYQNQRVGNIKLLDKNLGNELFRNFLIDYLSETILKEAYGGAQPNISGGAIENISIALPPLSEQDRISQKLDELLSQVDTLKARIDAIPALLKRFRQSVLSAAVSGQLTEEWRISSSDSFSKIAVKSTNGEKVVLNKSDSVWSFHSLGSIITGIEQGWSPKCESDSVGKNEKTWAVIKTTAIQPIEFNPLENKRLPLTLSPKPELTVKAGDLLITRAGPRSRAAVCCYVKETNDYLIVCDKAYRFRARVDVIEGVLLCFFLNSPQYVSLLDGLKTGISESGMNLTMLKFKDLEMPCPPIAEQTEIVSRVKQLFAFADQLEAKVAAAKNRIDHLTQSILAKAFRGELVPQDPNDEPASVLLERIKAQRAAAPKVKRGRKASV